MFVHFFCWRGAICGFNVENCQHADLHTRAQMCWYLTTGRRPPRITRRVMNTVTRGWVGAPNERAPFRFHDAVVGFADRCLSRARRISDSNWTLLMSFSQLGPTPAQEWFFSVFFGILDLFKWGFVLIASGTEILWRVQYLWSSKFFWQHFASASA